MKALNSEIRSAVVSLKFHLLSCRSVLSQLNGFSHLANIFEYLAVTDWAFHVCSFTFYDDLPRVCVMCYFLAKIIISHMYCTLYSLREVLLHLKSLYTSTLYLCLRVVFMGGANRALRSCALQHAMWRPMLIA